MVQKIIAAGLHSADAECTAYTTDLMEKLEQAKAENPSEDAILDDVAASAYCEQFALTTFEKGDRDMTDNKATKYVGHEALEFDCTDSTSNTADTLLAASAFLDMLSIWKKDDPEITSKTKYAKYHALRIIRATKAGEDPNLTNPVKEMPPELESGAALDPNDPEVQSINQGASTHNPYQPYVETAPSTNAQPSPSFSARNVSPPPNLPNVPTGYSQNAHNDVSPISQPTSSRRGSERSIGGGYFPRTDPPTFTAGNVAPSLPTAPSMDHQVSTPGLGQSTLPTDSSLPQAPQPPDPASFYQNPASPSPSHSELPASPPQSTYRSPPGVNPYAAPPQAPPQAPQQPTMFNSPHNQPQHYNSPPPQQPQPAQAVSQYARPPQANPYAQPSAPPPASSQGPFKDDERSIAEAQKHAKWAISALNFDDAATAVKELRIALQALGAN